MYVPQSESEGIAILVLWPCKENPIHEAHEAAIHAGKIYRRAEDEAIGILCLFDEIIHDVVKCAASQPGAASAGHTPLDGFLADPEHFGFNTRLKKRSFSAPSWHVSSFLWVLYFKCRRKVRIRRVALRAYGSYAAPDS